MPVTATPRSATEALCQTYLQAWEAGDAGRIAALHTPDTRFQVHAGGEPVTGRVAARAAFAELLAQWPNLRVDVHRTLIGDEHWVLDWTLRSSGGPAGDVRFGCLDVVTVEDGLVARKDTYLDLAQLQAAPAGA